MTNASFAHWRSGPHTTVVQPQRAFQHRKVDDLVGHRVHETTAVRDMLHSVFFH
jgi:hypothetical protein